MRERKERKKERKKRKGKDNMNNKSVYMETESEDTKKENNQEIEN